jgi:hypothetical protein
MRKLASKPFGNCRCGWLEYLVSMEVPVTVSYGRRKPESRVRRPNMGPSAQQSFRPIRGTPHAYGVGGLLANIF